MLMNYGNGFTHSDVYGMPVYLRRFYLSLLKDAKESENKHHEKTKQQMMSKMQSRKK